MSGLINPTPALQVYNCSKRVRPLSSWELQSPYMHPRRYNNAMTQAPYLKIVYFTATPSAGTLVVHPTSNGTSGGTTVFSNIFHATATPWALSATLVITIAGQSISSDYKTITFSLMNVNGLVSTSSNTCTVVVDGAP